MTRMEVPPKTAIHCKFLEFSAKWQHARMRTLLVDYIECGLNFCYFYDIHSFFFDVRVNAVLGGTSMRVIDTPFGYYLTWHREKNGTEF
jgi:hypothetical protein